MGYVIIPKPHFSSCDGMNIHRGRFDWCDLDICVICHVRRHLAPLSPVRLVGAAQLWPHLPASLGHSSKQSRGRLRIRDSFWVFFAYKKWLGRTETRTRDRMCFQSIRTVWDIYWDDRARIATCSLLKPGLYFVRRPYCVTRLRRYARNGGLYQSRISRA